MQASKKVEVRRTPLRLFKVILVCSNYISHTFHLCSAITVSYLLCITIHFFVDQLQVLGSSLKESVLHWLLRRPVKGEARL